jgi:hypothetical protein
MILILLDGFHTFSHRLWRTNVDALLDPGNNKCDEEEERRAAPSHNGEALPPARFADQPVPVAR